MKKKGLMFSLDAILALSLVAIAATVFVFSFNVEEPPRSHLLKIKDDLRDNESVAFMTGQNTADLNLEGYNEETWNTSYSFAACEKSFTYNPRGLDETGIVEIEYLCKGIS